ncbi:MAG: phosphoribosylanthranilate isomerase [bacterium]
MSYFNIKICGITRPSDAKLAAELGANMIGMIYYKKSPRYITLKQASAIVKVVPPTVHKVGVFVDTELNKILNTAHRLNLDFIQFQGDYNSSDVLKAKKLGFKTIQVFHIRNKKDYKNVYKSNADLVLLDHKTATQPGGTGETFDWGINPPRKIKNLILAGGINSNNMKDGIKIFSPLAIDVCSSVESTPGVKSVKKLKELFEVCNRLRYGK